ncbi:MAG: hypothetical protein QM638_01240 [Nocardioides sp.]|uniref:hypothetical protein n=1 Tax=Nocardioides sp. TaxID=35761 RepID=UPI0039E416F3
MAKNGTITGLKFDEAAIKKLLSSEEVQDDLNRRGQAIADACNADSSWGGYESGPVDGAEVASVNVWSIGENDDEARRQRLIRFMDAGA